jgi:hypothetical protein
MQQDGTGRSGFVRGVRAGACVLSSFLILAAADVAVGAGAAGGRDLRAGVSGNPKGGAGGQIAFTAKRIVVSPEAVPRLAAALRMDLDVLTGRVVLSPEETTRLLTRLSAEPSAVVLSESSCAARSGVEATANSTRSLTYRVTDDDEENRELGSMLSLFATLGPVGGIIHTTMNVGSASCVGDLTTCHPKHPLFESFSLTTSLTMCSGSSILLRGGRSTRLRLGGAASRSGGQKNLFPAECFLLLTARDRSARPPATGGEPCQPFVAYRLLDVGPAAAAGVRRLIGQADAAAAVVLTAQQYRDLDKLVRSAPDSMTLWSSSLVTGPSQEASTKWVQEDVRDTGRGQECHEIGGMFTTLASIAPDGKTLNVTLRAELAYPSLSGSSRRSREQSVLPVNQTLDIESGQLKLLSVPVPDGFLKADHRCYLIVTARVLGQQPGSSQGPDRANGVITHGDAGTMPSPLTARLDKTILPVADFRQADIRDVARFLESESNRLGNGVKIRVAESPNPVPPITWSARSISLSQALQFISRVADLECRMDRQHGEVVLVPKEARVRPPERNDAASPESKYRSMQFTVTLTAEGLREVKRIAGDEGESSLPGASVTYVSEVNRLIIVTLKDRADAVDAFVRKHDGTTVFAVNYFRNIQFKGALKTEEFRELQRIVGEGGEAPLPNARVSYVSQVHKLIVGTSDDRVDAAVAYVKKHGGTTESISNGPDSKTTPIAERLNKAVLPEAAFAGAAIHDVVRFLEEESERCGNGVKIRLSAGGVSIPPITWHAQRFTLHYALQEICRMAELECRIEPTRNEVVLEARNGSRAATAK